VRYCFQIVIIIVILIWTIINKVGIFGQIFSLSLLANNYSKQNEINERVVYDYQLIRFVVDRVALGNWRVFIAKFIFKWKQKKTDKNEHESISD
jgi:hypothetical protein